MLLFLFFLYTALGIAMKKLMPFIFTIIITSLATLSASEHGAVIILHGTSSAGKTAIMQELQKIDNARYHACDSDSLMKTFLTEHPLDPTNNDYNMRLLATLFNSFFKMIQDITDTGITVICDSVDTFFTEKIYQTFPNKKVFTVLVYLPFDTIQQRVNDYNQHYLLLKDTKTAIMAVRQFLELYKPQDHTHERIIDTVTTDSIKTALQEIIDTYTITLTSNDASAQTLIPYAQKTYGTTIKNFSLNTTTHINLVATIAYDVMVNSSMNSAQKNALIIYDYITKL